MPSFLLVIGPAGSPSLVARAAHFARMPAITANRLRPSPIPTRRVFRYLIASSAEDRASAGVAINWSLPLKYGRLEISLWITASNRTEIGII